MYTKDILGRSDSGLDSAMCFSNNLDCVRKSQQYEKSVEVTIFLTQENNLKSEKKCSKRLSVMG